MSRRSGCWCGGDGVCEVCCTDPEDGELSADFVPLAGAGLPPPRPAPADQRRWGVDIGRGWRRRERNTCEHWTTDEERREMEAKCSLKLQHKDREWRRLIGKPADGWCDLPGRLYNAQGATCFTAVFCPHHAEYYRRNFVLTPVEAPVVAVPHLRVVP